MNRQNWNEKQSSCGTTYRGIRHRSGKWVSEIREPRKTTRIWLGTFATPEMAAAAHDVAELCLKGTNAVLNFPNYIHTYPVPASLSPSDIRAAAVAAAEAMRPPCRIESNATGSSSSNGNNNNNNLGYDMGDIGRPEFVDEEALFDAPNFLVNMAEGMLLSPPRINSPLSDCYEFPKECYYEESLWSYSLS